MIHKWGTERRLNAYSDYFRKTFGGRVQKLTINAGFTCPNRDGTLGVGGCTFCDNSAFNPSYNESLKSVHQQLEEGIEFHKMRYRRVNKYLAYFQAYTNTYAPLDELTRLYQPALDHPEVIGLVIGTRPDCVDERLLDYFAELSEKVYVVLEYGIESVNNAVLKRVNRGHNFEKLVWAVEETAKRRVKCGGHMIIGLPGEDREDWLSSTDVLSALPLNNIKYHQLQLIKGTVMAKEWAENPEAFHRFEMEDYLFLMSEILERLRPDIVVERIAGEVAPGKAVQKGWGVRYDQVLRRFEEILEERDTWQGKLYKEKV